MKAELIFTQYVEHHDEFKVSVDVKASFNGVEYSYCSPDYSQQKATDEHLDGVLRMALDDIINQVIVEQNKHSENPIHPVGMTLSDKLSQFEIRQHVDFNNGLNKWHRDTNIILAAIW